MTKSKSSKATNEYKIGDRVFAKLKGYPWWPARIESVEKTKPVKYKILFYATYETNVIKSDALVAFNKESIKKYGEPRKYKFFNEAMNEIQNDPDLQNLQNDEDSEEGDNEEEEELEEEKSEENPQSDNDESVNKEDNLKLDFEKQSTEQSVSDGESDTESEKTNGKKSRDKSESKKSIKRLVQKKNKNQENSTKENSIEKSSKKSKNDEKKENLKKKFDSKKSIEKDDKMDVDDSESTKSSDGLKNEKDSDSDIDKISSYRKSIREKKPNKRFLDEDLDEKPTNVKTRKIIVSDDEEEKKNDLEKEPGMVSNQVKHEQEKITETKKLTESPKEKLSNMSPKPLDNLSPKTKSKTQAFQKIQETDKEKKLESPKKALKKNPESSSENLANLNKETKLEEIDTNNKIPLSISELGKKLKSEAKERWSKMTPTEREAEKQKLKEKKNYEKKLAKIKSIKIQFALLRMDVEIKKSLKEDNMNIEQCCLLLQDLIKLPFTQKNLFKAPEIVETIRKCRKFKSSEKVKEIANECFYKFLYMFPLNAGDSFWTFFEKERLKYLSENEDELKKERVIANKLLSLGTSKPKKSLPSRSSSSSLKSEQKSSSSKKFDIIKNEKNDSESKSKNEVIKVNDESSEKKDKNLESIKIEKMNEENLEEKRTMDEIDSIVKNEQTPFEKTDENSIENSKTEKGSIF